MGKARKDEPGADWRHATLSIAVVFSIVGTLALGAMLEAGPEKKRGHSSFPQSAEKMNVPVSSPAVEAEVDPEPSAEPDPDPGLPFSGDADLVDRAVADERRLGVSGDGYTLQFGVMCDAENVRSTFESLAAESSFYLVTMLYRDRACFRICWGFYDTESQAAAERTIPETLRRITASPKVISVADALP